MQCRESLQDRLEANVRKAASHMMRHIGVHEDDVVSCCKLQAMDVCSPCKPHPLLLKTHASVPIQSNLDCISSVRTYSSRP